MIAKKKNLRDSQNKRNEKKKRWLNPLQTNFLLKKKGGGGIFSLFERLFIFLYMKISFFKNKYNQKYIEIIGWARSTSATLRS